VPNDSMGSSSAGHCRTGMQRCELIILIPLENSSELDANYCGGTGGYDYTFGAAYGNPAVFRARVSRSCFDYSVLLDR